MPDFFASLRTLPSFDEIGYAQNRLDRNTEYRTDTSLSDAMAKETARYYLFHGETLVVRDRQAGLQALFCRAKADALGADFSKVILLGDDVEDGNAPRLAAVLSDEAAERLAEPSEDGHRLETVRAVGLRGLLPADELGAIAQARSLLNWHASHRYCSRCGTETIVALAGARRDCPSCSAVHFPRTDPVVIMLAIHVDEAGVERCLLGHHTRFDTPMYTTLAGFMEQGETLEAAVRREIFEESGVRIGAVRYMASQPWPFPSSLMLGCFAEATTSEIVIDDTELTHAGWYTRDEVREMMAREYGCDLPHIPGHFSIAAWLIRCWVDAV